ncbi:MAG: hypothetical protein Q9184_003460 [Pyrenodesmia sp. 2 TL-2023]
MTAPSSLSPSQSRSPHLTDPFLQPFLSPSFSASTYLNTHLPSPPSSTTTLSKPTSNPQQSLTSITAQTQSHISTLSAQTTRLSATLTALTDDILRCSTRLAYEIEVLRGDADSLVSALTSPGSELSAAIKTFIPNGLERPSSNTNLPSSPSSSEHHPPVAVSSTQAQPTQDSNASSTTTEASLTHLRTLLSVRHSLQRITQLFSLALSWPMPPSLLSSSSNSNTITSSLISVSSPASQQEVAEQEEKGRAALARLRGEVEAMLAGPGDEGVEKARRRVEELRECMGVWKGTGEERARERWVRELEGRMEGEVTTRGRKEGSGAAAAGRVEKKEERRAPLREEVPSRTGSGAGFLRRLRDEIYLE